MWSNLRVKFLIYNLKLQCMKLRFSDGTLLTLLCGIHACTWKNINYPDSLRLSFVFSIINIDSPKPFK